MAKRSERSVRTVKETLTVPAASRARQKAAAAVLVATPQLVNPQNSLLGPGSSTPDGSGGIGTPGTLNTWGFITGEDYNPDLDGYPMFPFYDKMRRGDAQVWASLLQVKLPFKAARKVIKPASDDLEDVAIAEFVTECLLGERAMKRPFEQVLDHLMLRFDFGCSAEEIIWEIGEAGELRFRDLAPRLPRTFYRWLEHADGPQAGDLKALEQFAPKNGSYGSFTIPADRLVLHTHRREGNNYYGISLLRAAYPHWFWKQQLYRIDAIRHDRFGAGIFVACLNENYNAKTAPIATIEETLKGLRSHQQSYAIQPHGVEFKILAPASGSNVSTDLIQSIEHHNQMIAANVLQQFSTQGQQKHGSFSGAKVTFDAFYDALLGQGMEMSAEISDGAIRRLCDANFDMTGRAYPRFAFADLAAPDVSAIAETMSKLANSKVLTPDDELENFVRELIDAPALPEELKGKRTTTPAPIPPGLAPKPPDNTPPGEEPPAGQVPVKGAPPTPVEAATRVSFHEGGRIFGREPSALERRIFSLHAVPATLDELQARLVRRLTEVRLSQLRAVATTIAKKDARASTGAFTDIRPRHITVPKVADIKAAIRETQLLAFNYGRDSVREELTKQGALNLAAGDGDPTAAKNATTAKSTLVSSAQITARKQSETWLGRIMDVGLRLRRGGKQGSELEQGVVDTLSSEAETGAKRDAAAEVHEAFAVGRATEASAQKDQIEKVVYSALLDANTCEACEALDGEEMEYGSDRYFETMPPYQGCDGNKGSPDACRCVHLFLFNEEA